MDRILSFVRSRGLHNRKHVPQKKEELEEAKKFAEQLAALKADCIIATEPALIEFCAGLKGIRTVASTQLNIHNVMGAQTAKAMGADVAVFVQRNNPRRYSRYKPLCGY